MLRIEAKLMGMGMGMVACLCLCLCVCAVEQQPPYTAATTAANNSPGRWMNISEEHGEGWGEKGFPELEAKMEKVFELFNNRTFPIYESDIKHGGWKKNGIVVINPHALTYGGFGNLIISAMGVVLYAFSQKRAPVLSHGLVSALFQHPDPRQSWTGLSPSEANSPAVAHTIVRIECNHLPNERGEWGKGKVSWKFVGLHGTPCLIYGYKSAAAQVPELFGLAPSSRTSLSDDLMCQAFSAWMFSTLTPQATEALSLYRNDFKENCGSPDDPIDLAVQVRANDNIEAPFLPDLQQCYVECAARKGLQLEKTLGRKVCIFVTSNRDSLADYIVEHLRSVSSNFAFLAHAYNDTHVEGTKHSISLSKEWKSVDHINSTQLFRQAGDVMDWLLLGEATYSVHTDSGSSFVNSARLRLGPTRLRSVFDPLQLDLVPYVVDGTCVCKERKKSCITGPFR